MTREETSTHIRVHELGDKVGDNFEPQFKLLGLFADVKTVVEQFFEVFQAVLVHRVDIGKVGNHEVKQ